MTQMAVIETLSTYVKAHEKLVGLVILGVILYVGVGKIDTLIAHHDSANLDQAKVTLQAQQSKDAVTAQLALQQAQQLATETAAAKAQAAALEQANATLTAALSKQQVVDNAMALPALAQRWQTLVPNVTLTASATSITVDNAGAHDTVSQLELIPVLTTELANETTEKNTDLALISTANTNIATLNTEISGLRLENTKAEAVCKDQLKTQKDDFDKKLRHRTFWAYVAGFATAVGLLR
jgi:hypothetical protein